MLVGMPEELEEHALDALAAVGQSWRGDWSDFDGRTLRDQLNSWIATVRLADADWKAWLDGWGICPECHSFTEHCFCERGDDG